jgi:hypothetical protein
MTHTPTTCTGSRRASCPSSALTSPQTTNEVGPVGIEVRPAPVFNPYLSQRIEVNMYSESYFDGDDNPPEINERQASPRPLFIGPFATAILLAEARRAQGPPCSYLCRKGVASKPLYNESFGCGSSTSAVLCSAVGDAFGWASTPTIATSLSPKILWSLRASIQCLIDT